MPPRNREALTSVWGIMDYLDRLDCLKGLKDDWSPQFVFLVFLFFYINELEKLHNSTLMEQGNLFTQTDYFSRILCSVLTVHLTTIHCTHLFSSHTPDLNELISGDAVGQDDMCYHVETDHTSMTVSWVQHVVSSVFFLIDGKCLKPPTFNFKLFKVLCQWKSCSWLTQYRRCEAKTWIAQMIDYRFWYTGKAYLCGGKYREQ